MIVSVANYPAGIWEGSLKINHMLSFLVCAPEWMYSIFLSTLNPKRLDCSSKSDWTIHCKFQSNCKFSVMYIFFHHLPPVSFYLVVFLSTVKLKSVVNITTHNSMWNMWVWLKKRQSRNNWNRGGKTFLSDYDMILWKCTLYWT